MSSSEVVNITIPKALHEKLLAYYKEICALDPDHAQNYPTLEDDIVLTIQSGLDAMESVIQDLKRASS